MAVDPSEIEEWSMPLVRDVQATYRRDPDSAPFSDDPYTDPRIQGVRQGRGSLYRAAPRGRRTIQRRQGR